MTRAASFSALVTLLAATPALTRAAEVFEIVHTAAPIAARYPTGKLFKNPDGTFIVNTDLGGKGAAGGIFTVNPSGGISLVGSFYGANGAIPTSGVTKASDGNFYGATSFGGRRDAGTVFRMTPGGTITKLAEFIGSNGAYPETPLVEGSNGFLYGTTPAEGNQNGGTAFKISKTGTLTVLAHFPAFVEPSGLVKGSDGHFYGTTESGGAQNLGTVFQLTEAGALSTIASFAGTNGSKPVRGLTLGSDGLLYGATAAGGANQFGVFFRLSNQTIEALSHFDITIGEPLTPVIEGAAGEFYGVTRGAGTVFKATSAGGLTKFADFPVGITSYGASPLIIGNDGAFYGTTSQSGFSNVGVLYRVGTDGAFSTATTFGAANGNGFTSTLARGGDGHLYGTAAEGGAGDFGVFFKLNPDGTYTKLGEFNPTLGRPVIEGIIRGNDGNFYGTTRSGGGDCHLFRATAGGTLTSVASFNTFSGGSPQPTGVMQASDGNFYGVLNNVGADSKGIIFRYNSGAGLTSLFEPGTLGENAPSGAAGPLVEGEDGALYGATTNGGTKGFGALFRITPSGQYTVLASFNGSNGRSPSGPLVLAQDGNFYGMTTTGGTTNVGVVYRLTPAGALSVVTHLTGFNGAFPRGGLTRGPGGNLYGVAVVGGSSDRGVLFKVSLAGKVTVIKQFDGDNTGAFPVGTLTLGPDSNLYGATYDTIFRLALNNQPPVVQNDTFDLPLYGGKVLKNDSDADSDPLTIVAVTQGAHGTVELNADNTITYLPGETFTENDTFTYTVSDGFNPPVQATVTVREPVLLSAVKGVYAGMITDSLGNPVGYWGLAVTPGGAFSSAVRLNGKRFSSRSSTKLVDNHLEHQIPRKNLPPLVIVADVDPARNIVVGTVTDGAETYTLRLERLFPLYTKTDPTPRAGRYTMLLPATPTMLADPELPHGTGIATMNVTKTGIVSMVGKMGDGTPFTTASLVTREDTFPLYAELYKKPKGYLAGLVVFTPGQPSEGVAPALVWHKPAQKSPNYPEGFTTSPGFLLSRYQPPAKGQMFLNLGVKPLGNATLAFTGLPIAKTLNISTKNLVSIPFPAADRVNVVINPATGFFTGKFTDPTDGLRRNFGGAVLQNQLRGEGFYFGINAGKNITEKIDLAPIPD